ncbi:hypothetical protein [Prevotella corporis]|uniref:hypothetical protein n=1 Tax=Prevotella corporis TaxID=28128 RepID=UPI0012DF0A59|nr:hypothetical protein [Prevotella corporis]
MMAVGLLTDSIRLSATSLSFSHAVARYAFARTTNKLLGNQMKNETKPTGEIS